MSDCLQIPAGDLSYLTQALKSLDFAFTVSDPSKPDNPICYASSKFYETTQYTPDEVLGKNCRFLQGPETDQRKVMEIRDAMREQRPCQVCLLNYKKNGEKFWNQFYLAPVRDAQQSVVHYVGIQTDVTAAVKEKQQAAASVSGASIASGEESEDEVEEALRSEQRNADLISDALTTAHGSDEWLNSEPIPTSLMQQLMKIQRSFVLADPHLPDCPIVHASDQFLQMTGYSREEVIGRNCRFLQGPDTDPRDVQRIRDALKSPDPKPVTVSLLNYRKDGSPFWNCLHLAPMRDSSGTIMFIIGVQLDLSVDAGHKFESGVPKHGVDGGLGRTQSEGKACVGVGERRKGKMDKKGAVENINMREVTTKSEGGKSEHEHDASVSRCDNVRGASGGEGVNSESDHGAVLEHDAVHDMLEGAKQEQHVSRVRSAPVAQCTTSYGDGNGGGVGVLSLERPSVGMAQKLAHQGVTGAVRVAVRALGGEQGLRRTENDQCIPGR
uniref:Putative LOV domain-containing protein n=1 Tax=Hafniomonas reticulata TaxID=51322 RepID=A0A126WX49_9CHLO|nr:putative LOV domain-containing protein [Hafniomonas reticulata]